MFFKGRAEQNRIWLVHESVCIIYLREIRIIILKMLRNDVKVQYFIGVDYGGGRRGSASGAIWPWLWAAP